MISDVLILICALYGALLLLISYVWLRMKAQAGANSCPDVIVAARNEEANIEHCVESIFRTGNLKRLIVVDDHSDDATLDILQRLKVIHGEQLIILKNDAFGKKKAIEKALNVADAEWVLLTDADSEVPSSWTSVMSPDDGSKMICGPVKYKPGSWVRNIQQLELAGLVASGAAFTKLGSALMCNGANIGYSRKIFLELKGYDRLSERASGDDTLLMQKIEKHYPGQVAFNKNRNAMVQTAAAETLADLWQQRRRWASKTFYGKHPVTIAVAALVYLANLSLPVSFLFASELNCNVAGLIAMAALKMGAEVILFATVLPFFAELRLLLLVPFVQIVYPFYVVITGALAPFTRFTWKGRSLR